jgi:putative membrane protein
MGMRTSLHRAGSGNARAARRVHPCKTHPWSRHAHPLTAFDGHCRNGIVSAAGPAGTQRSADRPHRRDGQPGDIDAGKLAAKKGSTEEVRKFGTQMVTDHTAVNQQATELAKKLKVTPRANDTSASLRKGGDQNLAALAKLSGKQFDKHYVDNEVTYHQAVIDAVDKTLLPSAKNEELKTLIQKVRPALVQHLEHAKHLQSQLAK